MPLDNRHRILLRTYVEDQTSARHYTHTETIEVSEDLRRAIEIDQISPEEIRRRYEEEQAP